MKCERCGNELIGVAIVCRACNHNNALHSRLAWRRTEPPHSQSTPPRASGPPAESPTIIPRKDADVNLLHFPSALNRRAEAAPARQTLAESGPKSATHPPWRAELKERVRRIKEKRATSSLTAPNSSPLQSPRAQVGETKPHRNPIVESALKRIRWSSHEAGRLGDEATGRRGDFSQSRPVAQSPSRPVAQSPSRPVPPPLRLRFQPANHQPAGPWPARRINMSRRESQKSRKPLRRRDPKPSRPCSMRACWQASVTLKSSSRPFC